MANRTQHFSFVWLYMFLLTIEAVIAQRNRSDYMKLFSIQMIVSRSVVVKLLFWPCQARPSLPCDSFCYITQAGVAPGTVGRLTSVDYRNL